MSTGENIKRIRNIRGITQKELGIAVGIGEESAGPRMAQYETGKRTPKEKMLNKIAEVLEADPRNIAIPIGYKEEDMICFLQRFSIWNWWIKRCYRCRNKSFECIYCCKSVSGTCRY